MTLARRLKINQPRMPVRIYQQIMLVKIAMRRAGICGKVQRRSGHPQQRIRKSKLFAQGFESQLVLARPFYCILQPGKAKLELLSCEFKQPLVVVS